MRLSCYELSSDTRGAIMRVDEARFEQLVGARAGYMLFVAIRGDVSWTHCRDQEGDEKRPASPVHRADLQPIVNLARSGSWLTPSQACTMAWSDEVPEASADLVDSEVHRKHLEKGRRAVDVRLERRGRRGIWRSIAAGPKATNGERTYRFAPGKGGVTDGLGEYPIRYCVAWAVAERQEVVFAPKGGPGQILPVTDPGRVLAQRRDESLKVTVRDAVINLFTDELIFLVDLRSELSSSLVFFSRAKAHLLGQEITTEAPYEGSRVVLPNFDVSRWRVDASGRTTDLRAGQAVHFICLAFDLRAALRSMRPGPVESTRLSIWRDTYTELRVDVPVRVAGDVKGGPFRLTGAGWRFVRLARRARGRGRN